MSFFFITSCNESKPDIIESSNRIEQKHEPSDEFFLQRMGPDGHFALDAYTNALKQINQQTLTRTINGFEEEWITQGPGNIGARINTLKVHPTDENIIYAGFSEAEFLKLLMEVLPGILFLTIKLFFPLAILNWIHKTQKLFM